MSAPIDTTGYDYDGWIRFAFDHPVSTEPWYYTEAMHFVCDPARVITYYTRLFRDPVATLSRYDDAHVEQGLWFVVSSQLGAWLWDDDIALPLRIACIDAMPEMFRRFLIDHPLDTSCFMWWDMLRTFTDAPDPAIVAGMARALEQVLHVPARHCQLSALHGLGHLPHESRAPIIRAFLEAHPEADAELRDYAEHAILGEVL